MTNEAQQKRYDSAWFNALTQVAKVDAMLHSYPQAGDDATPEQAYELEDLARQLNALTAVWSAGIPA
jgi:hypothetical protein